MNFKFKPYYFDSDAYFMLLILASASPARSNLLTQVNITHQVKVSDVDESQFSSIDPKELVRKLAIAKAKSVVSMLNHQVGSLCSQEEYLAILGCDSLFEFDGEIFGKPKNISEAFDRWKRMSAHSGIIHTGHCLTFLKPLNDEGQLKKSEVNDLRAEVVSTQINFAEVPNDDIEAYVRTNEPMKCAGAFAIDGKGALFINSIEGCYSNVMGLSLPWLKNAISKAGFSIKDLIC